MRVRALLVAVLFLGGGLASHGSAPVQAQTGQDLVDACIEGGGSPSMCRGLHQLLRTVGGLCRDASDDDPMCTLIDGISIQEALVRAHENSWLARALALQEALDDHHPLRRGLWPHTHNSYNADAYPPTFYGLDRNHIYTITDQLRMGIRAIEIDIHWAPSTSTQGEDAVIVCHGQAVDLFLAIVHVGCGLNDPLLAEVLAEVKAWMDANPDEVLMVYLENNLDDVPAAHAQATAALTSAFGGLVHRPSSRCADLPIDSSRADIAASGARVILVGNCGPGDWGNLVFQRGSRWKEGGLGYGDDFPAYPCAQRRAAQDYPDNWIRHWGDETGLSAGAQTGGDVTVNDARNMTRCGVNMIGFDNLVPFDERLAQLVWSWGPDEPSRSEDGYCAVQQADTLFRAADCTVERKVIVRKNKRPKRRVIVRHLSHPYACFDGADWHVTQRSDRWSRGSDACAAEGLGAFSVPWNGYENQRLREATPTDVGDVWLNHRASGGSWRS